MASTAPYLELANTVAAAGFFTSGVHNMEGWQRTCICGQRRPEGGYTGNSFWASYLGGTWYLGTWGGWVYRLPNSSQVGLLCVEWLTRVPVETRADFDDAIKQRYTLEEVADEEFDRLTRFGH